MQSSAPRAPADPAISPTQPKRHGLADALHLAVAIESGCDVYLTNDNHLSKFADLTVEELPRIRRRHNAPRGRRRGWQFGQKYVGRPSRPGIFVFSIG